MNVCCCVMLYLLSWLHDCLFLGSWLLGSVITVKSCLMAVCCFYCTKLFVTGIMSRLFVALFMDVCFILLLQLNVMSWLFYLIICNRCLLQYNIRLFVGSSVIVVKHYAIVIFRDSLLYRLTFLKIT